MARATKVFRKVRLIKTAPKSIFSAPLQPQLVSEHSLIWGPRALTPSATRPHLCCRDRDVRDRDVWELGFVGDRDAEDSSPMPACPSNASLKQSITC